MDIRTLGIRPGSIIELAHTEYRIGRARIVSIDNNREHPLEVEWLSLDWATEVIGQIEFHDFDDWSSLWKLCEAEFVSGILERYQNSDNSTIP